MRLMSPVENLTGLQFENASDLGITELVTKLVCIDWLFFIFLENI